MKKQSLLLLLSLLMSMGGTKGYAHDIASNYQSKTIYYNYINNKTELQVTCQGTYYNSYSDEYSGQVVIPKNVYYNGTNYPVTSINNDAFHGCKNLTHVTIPNSVTSIGLGAFQGCSNLASITIPKSVTEISQKAFSYCTSLTSITIPNSVTNIGYQAFDHCTSLTNITLPNSVTSIIREAFLCCTSLTSITIPNSVTYIGCEAFEACTSLTDITLSNSLTSIEENVFERCEKLNSITIPNSVTTIGKEAFIDCSSLKSVTIGNSVTSIGSSAFENCTSLKKAQFASIESLCKINFTWGNSNPLYYAHHLYIEGEEIINLEIPNSVTTIGEYTFYGCSSLKSVDISNTVTSIGMCAFSGCSSLTSVTIPNSMISIGQGAFGDCSQLTNINFPNSLTSIGEDAFYGCSQLANINFPNSLTKIGNDAFYNTAWFNNQPDGLVYAGKIAYKYKGIAPANTKISIIDGTLFINEYAFYDERYTDEEGFFEVRQTGLTSITIPNSVTSIGEYAFYGCSGLKNINIPNSVTNIGGCAFNGCSSLTSINIPNSVTTIGMGAFGGCSGLTSINIPNSVTSIGEYAFSGCSGLSNINIPNSVTSIGEYAFYGCSGLSNIIIPNSVTSIGEYAFRNCSNLNSVTIGNSLMSLGNYAFGDCTNLLSIKVKITEPFTINYRVFNNDYSATLYVPRGCRNKFYSDDNWNYFFADVEEMDFVVLDENDTAAPIAAEDVEICLKRTINTDEWSTLVLPFSMSEDRVKATFGDDVELADFTGYEVVKNGDAITSMTINFTDVTAIEANHPYIIKVSDPMNYIEVDNATINATAKPSKTYSNGDLQGSFTGTYVSDFDFYTASDYGHPLFLSGNEFWYATASTKHMKAFRAYFDFNQAMEEAVAAGARITMNIGDAPTGINSFAVSPSSNDAGSIYDLQGRRVTAPSKGIYMRNGKKIIMK